MNQLAERLRSLSSAITEICQISGNVGLSVGVVHHGQVIHRANFGHRDIANGIAPNSDTVYSLCSLIKAMTAAAYGILVDHQDFRWDTCIRDIYSFQQMSDIVRERAIVTNFLAHRTDLTSRNCYWHQSRQQLLLSKGETASTISILESVGTLHETFMYSN